MAIESSGAILKGARIRAGLSQVALAERAHVTQSVISSYERGAREPSLSTLARLIEATGFELQLDLRQVDAPVREVNRALSGEIGRRLRRHRRSVVRIIERHGLKSPRVFGSVARGDEHAGSDVDLLVDVPIGVGLFALARCQAELEALLHAPVDLIPASDLKATIAQTVLDDAIAL
ncbi:MAG TPA: helix-turn-helix domain-containing protein [Acidimicrobiales bacterium]|nr:helix-turn-helix domain-containing protein [Acidimicrobiales bacterium]